MKAVRIFGVWIALALPLAVALSAASAVFPPTSVEIRVAKGKALYESRCAQCHGPMDSAAKSYGPALGNIGQVAASRVPGISGVEYIVTSIVDPNAYRPAGTSAEMPAKAVRGLSTSEVLSIAAFLLSESGDVPYRELLAQAKHAKASQGVDAPATKRASIERLERGRALFFGDLHCSHCHPLDASPGGALLAPSLATIGMHDEDYLRRALLAPEQQIAPGYEQWSVMCDGEVLTGRRINAGVTSSLLMQRPEGLGYRIETIEAGGHDEGGEDEVVLRKQNNSLMPGYRLKLTPDDVESLVSFLSLLR